jgi:hypothetical protein
MLIRVILISHNCNICTVIATVLLKYVFFSQDYKHVGCFGDAGDRALPIYLGSSPSSVIVEICAEKTDVKNYPAFSVQNGRECWSGPSSDQTYDKHGPSTKCNDGVGGTWAGDVYFFVHGRYLEKRTHLLFIFIISLFLHLSSIFLIFSLFIYRYQTQVNYCILTYIILE